MSTAATGTKEQAVGIYSAKAAEQFGTHIWLDADGTEHEVTAIDKPSQYKWDDAVILGPMARYRRPGRRGRDVLSGWR